MKVSTALGYMNIPDGVLMDLNHIKSLPKNKVCIITTGSQGDRQADRNTCACFHRSSPRIRSISARRICASAWAR